MDSYVSYQVDNNEDEWSEFISKDRKETSENLSINLSAHSQGLEKLSRQMQVMRMIQMMSGAKQLNGHQLHGYIIARTRYYSRWWTE